MGAPDRVPALGRSVDQATGVIEWDGEQLRESRGLSRGKEVVPCQLSPRSRSDLGQALTDKGEEKEGKLARRAARQAARMEWKRQQREMKTERTLANKEQAGIIISTYKEKEREISRRMAAKAQTHQAAVSAARKAERERLQLTLRRHEAHVRQIVYIR